MPKQKCGKNFEYKERGFLNVHDEGALAAYGIRVSSFSRTKRSNHGWINAALTLRDCTRSIDLDFDVNMNVDNNTGELDYTEYNDRMEKIDLLISKLETLKKKLEMACVVVECVNGDDDE